MKILMSETAPGSVDGISVATYKTGEQYDLTATAGERDLAAAFVGAGLAVEVGAEPVEVDPPDPTGEPEVKARPGRKSKQ
jgi:hypothetical protein